MRATSRQLPVSTTPELVARSRALAGRHGAALAGMVALHASAAAAGLAAPALLGYLVQQVVDGTTAGKVDEIALLLAAALIVQTVLTWFARYVSFWLSERIFAELREDFMARVLALPLSTVERAGVGDLVSRTTADIDALARTVRFAVPETLVAAVTTILTVAAVVWVSPLASLACLTGVPLLVVGTRWYLKRAPAGYLWFPSVELACVIPVAASLLWGGWLVSEGRASIGQVTAVVLYMVQLADPVDRLISWLDEIQVGGASMARLVGIDNVPADRTISGEQPASEDLLARDARFAYHEGRDVLHGVDLELRTGERLAVVGPSGAGKSTIGRLLAGIHPPRTGEVSLGGVPLVALPLEQLRQEVALVTQEQHVFVGTLGENLRLARPEADDRDLWEALEGVDAHDWATALPEGLGTPVGAGGVTLTPAQTQQLALARLVLADPHTLVLDEATSLLDPRAARHLERSLGSLLDGRTVVAIAHRLHTAHDADRVAVVEDGLVTELGSHHELLERGGSYAALWESWQT